MQRRDRNINVRLTQSERQALDRLVLATPETPTYSEWIRLQIRNGIRLLDLKGEGIDVDAIVTPHQIRIYGSHGIELCRANLEPRSNA